MKSFRSVMHWRQGVRAAGGLLFASFLVTSGCSDEVGGDGWEPPQPTNTAGSTATVGGMGGDDGTATGGKGGSGGMAGKGGKGSKGGSAGTGIIFEDGGMGGQPQPGGAICGNMVVEEGEECDDGNTKSFDGCTPNCRAHCEECEKTFCTAVRGATAGEFNMFIEEAVAPSDLTKACQDLIGNAETGTAMGEKRSLLCQTMFECAKRERCAQYVPDDTTDFKNGRDYSFMRCMLDLDVNDPSFITRLVDTASYEETPTHKSLKGKCYQEFLDASEAEPNDLSKVLGGLYVKTKTFGIAHLLLQQCDKILCTEECFPEFSAGEVATISEDILATPNDANESALGDLLVDSQRAATATDIALLNLGAIAGEAAIFSSTGLHFKAAPGRAADAEGRVLESEIRQALFTMDGKGNAINITGGSFLVVLSMTGQRIYDLLEKPPSVEGLVTPLLVSGATYTWDASKPIGSRVVEVRRNDQPIGKAATFSVTMNNRLALAMLGGTQAAFDQGVKDGKVMVTDKVPEKEFVAYLKAQPQPVAAPKLTRITRAN